jgi:hypothetical protein
MNKHLIALSLLALTFTQNCFSSEPSSPLLDPSVHTTKSFENYFVLKQSSSYVQGGFIYSFVPNTDAIRQQVQSGQPVTISADDLLAVSCSGGHTYNINPDVDIILRLSMLAGDSVNITVYTDDNQDCQLAKAEINL